jgi:hypothetical protein
MPAEMTVSFQVPERVRRPAARSAGSLRENFSLPALSAGFFSSVAMEEALAVEGPSSSIAVSGKSQALEKTTRRLFSDRE